MPQSWLQLRTLPPVSGYTRQDAEQPVPTDTGKKALKVPGAGGAQGGCVLGAQEALGCELKFLKRCHLAVNKNSLEGIRVAETDQPTVISVLRETGML